MNQKIKELAEQARAKVRAEWGIGNKIPYPEAHYKFQNDIDQKLAELIVQECIDILLSDENCDGEYFEHVTSIVATQIAEHFGVE